MLTVVVLIAIIVWLSSGYLDHRHAMERICHIVTLEVRDGAEPVEEEVLDYCTEVGL